MDQHCTVSQSTKPIIKGIYKTEQSNYLKSKIRQTQESTDNKQSATAWKIINEISGRKTTNKAKLKAENQKARIDKWKSHFENLFGKPPKINEGPTKQIINGQLDIKIGNFTMKELKAALDKMSHGKACGLYKIPPEVWKTARLIRSF